jgi:hypothetical protein
MTPTLKCFGCGHRFGRKARSVLMLANCVFCNQCADDVKVHARVFFSCPHHHPPREHEGAVMTTIGRARESLAYQNPP